MVSMFHIGITFQHVHWIWLHLWWEHICLSFQFLPYIVNCKNDHKFFLFLYPCIVGNETWKLLPSRNGEFISLFFESGFRHVTDVSQGTLEKLMQAELWWMPEQWGLSSLAILRNSDLCEWVSASLLEDERQVVQLLSVILKSAIPHQACE